MNVEVVLVGVLVVNFAVGTGDPEVRPMVDRVNLKLDMSSKMRSVALAKLEMVSTPLTAESLAEIENTTPAARAVLVSAVNVSWPALPRKLPDPVKVAPIALVVAETTDSAVL